MLDIKVFKLLHQKKAISNQLNLQLFLKSRQRLSLKIKVAIEQHPQNLQPLRHQRRLNQNQVLLLLHNRFPNPPPNQYLRLKTKPQSYQAQIVLQLQNQQQFPHLNQNL